MLKEALSFGVIHIHFSSPLQWQIFQKMVLKIVSVPIWMHITLSQSCCFGGTVRSEDGQSGKEEIEADSALYCYSLR